MRNELRQFRRRRIIVIVVDPVEHKRRLGLPDRGVRGLRFLGALLLEQLHDEAVAGSAFPAGVPGPLVLRLVDPALGATAAELEEDVFRFGVAVERPVERMREMDPFGAVEIVNDGGCSLLDQRKPHLGGDVEDAGCTSPWAPPARARASASG